MPYIPYLLDASSPHPQTGSQAAVPALGHPLIIIIIIVIILIIITIPRLGRRRLYLPSAALSTISIGMTAALVASRWKITCEGSLPLGEMTNLPKIFPTVTKFSKCWETKILHTGETESLDV